MRLKKSDLSLSVWNGCRNEPGSLHLNKLFYGKKLLTLDTRLALLRRAKAGDHLAAKILTDHEERCSESREISVPDY